MHVNFSIDTETVSADEMTNQHAAAGNAQIRISLRRRPASKLLRFRNAKDGLGFLLVPGAAP
jgi:hypothetical protein